jgi:hypothetical protein
MAHRLSWSEIKGEYDQQWVLLTDYEWPEGTPNPTFGAVELHAHEKMDFDQALREAHETLPSDTAMLYVGTPPRASHAIRL